MSFWLLRRLGWMLLTVWAVFTVSFILMRSVPGGPFDEARAVPEDVRRAIEARYHLDRPLIEQYLEQLGGYLRLDPGPSFRQPDYSVGEIIAEGLGPSLLLGALAIILALAIGIFAGSTAALRAGSFGDQLVMVAATLGLALPGFVIAGLLVLTVSFHLGWLPPAGWEGPASLV
ncbi:MAG TPA: ABC transporter, partial [Planctomycetes bacterium]|nr:ABC transporter [Planctomycetota bacterium]